MSANPVPLCTQAIQNNQGYATQQNQDLLSLISLGGAQLLDAPVTPDTLAIDLRDYPPEPFVEPPAPPPTPIIPPVPAPTIIIPRVGYTETDVFWWATLARANEASDDTYLKDTIQARGPYNNYGFVAPPTGSLILGMRWWAMTDRFYVAIQGTQNDNQALQYVLSHVVGQQMQIAGQYFNSSFASQAAYLANLVRPAWVAAGSPPVCVLGYSYGGGVAAPFLLALRGNSNWNAYDRFVTFGAPKSCTSQSGAAFNTLWGIRFTANGDPIPALPPPQAVMVALNVGAVGGYPGGDYLHPVEQDRLQSNGIITNAPTPAANYVELIQLANLILSGNFSFSLHFMSNYAGLAYILNYWAPQSSAVDYANWGALEGINAQLAQIGI